MKKVLSITVALTMGLSLCACGANKVADASNEAAETSSKTTQIETEDSKTESEEAKATEESKELSSGDQLLVDVTGTYDELFTVITDSQYDQIWLDKCAEIVGDDMAKTCADMLKSACTGTIYGEEAVKTYTDAESAQFDCFFIDGVHQFVFDGNHISGLDKNNNEVFSHDYSYVKDFSLAGMMDGYLYETSDSDAGEFRYFLLFPDTPDSTYHIEFRYGSNEEELAKYNEGSYAYWLAAGIPATRDDTMIKNVIELFTEENLADMGDSEEKPAA